MDKQIIAGGVKKLGDNQLIVAIEELSELQKELCKYFRGKPNINHITEELSDVLIMCETVKQFFNISENDIEKIISEKLERIR